MNQAPLTIDLTEPDKPTNLCLDRAAPLHLEACSTQARRTSPQPLRVQQADIDHQAVSRHVTTAQDQFTSRLLDAKVEEISSETKMPSSRTLPTKYTPRNLSTQSS